LPKNWRSSAMALVVLLNTALLEQAQAHQQAQPPSPQRRGNRAFVAKLYL
jgi:hypothetical protein